MSNNTNDIFSPEVLQTELDKLPKNEANVDVFASQSDGVGVEATVSKQISKSGTIEADATWTKKMGYRIAGILGFKW